MTSRALGLPASRYDKWRHVDAGSYDGLRLVFSSLCGNHPCGILRILYTESLLTYLVPRYFRYPKGRIGNVVEMVVPRFTEMFLNSRIQALVSKTQQ